MAENEKVIIPYDFEIASISAIGDFQKEFEEPEFKIIPKIISREDEEFSVSFNITLIYCFKINFELIAFYEEEDLKDCDEDSLFKLIMSNCYPIYTKIIIFMGLILEQMGFVAYIPPFPRFLEALKIEK